MESSFPISLPKDVFCDILGYLNRNELEKCQLIAKKWKSLVDAYANILTIRKHYDVLWLSSSSTQALPVLCRVHESSSVTPPSFSIQCNDERMKELNENRLSPEFKSELRLLENGVFNTIIVLDVDIVALVMFLEKVMRVCGSMLRGKNCIWYLKAEGGMNLIVFGKQKAHYQFVMQI
jgi:hypothetical protein